MALDFNFTAKISGLNATCSVLDTPVQSSYLKLSAHEPY